MGVKKYPISVIIDAWQSCHLRRQPFQTYSGRHHFVLDATEVTF